MNSMLIPFEMMGLVSLAMAMQSHRDPRKMQLVESPLQSLANVGAEGDCPKSYGFSCDDMIGMDATLTCSSLEATELDCSGCSCVLTTTTSPLISGATTEEPLISVATTTNMAATPPPTQAHAPVDLCAGTLTTNNLGDQGPDPEGLPILRFQNVTSGPVSDVDLIVANINSYTAWNSSANGLLGVNSCWGNVNLKCGESIALKFSFVESEDSAPVSLAKFFFTIADIDIGTHGRCKESIEVSGFEEYHLSDTTKIIVKDSLGAYTFVGTAPGDANDNPVSLDMTQEQMDNSIGFVFEKVQTFTVIFHTDTDLEANHSDDPNEIGYAGRNFLFTGKTAFAQEADVGPSLSEMNE